MTDALLAYGIAKIKEYGIVDSGDAKKYGIGAMTQARWQDFFDTMSSAGVYPKDMDFKKAFTLALRRQENRDAALTDARRVCLRRDRRGRQPDRLVARHRQALRRRGRRHSTRSISTSAAGNS